MASIHPRHARPTKDMGFLIENYYGFSLVTRFRDDVIKSKIR